MTGSDDIIAAIASPPGVGAVSLIRVSGAGARELVQASFSGSLKQARFSAFGSLRAADATTIDEVLATFFEGPRSYTGEDTVEISGHGGVLVTRKILERLLDLGARAAEPGEFSQRAFFNGKLDLTQAEAVMDLITAQTELAMKSANEQLAGRLGDRLQTLREELIGIVAHVEAYIDFHEEDIDPETGEALLARIAGVAGTVDQLLATADQGRILREGVRTVICGAPNVGKSSLLNQLLGFDRAIVSATAGTTRDTIEEVINLEGIPLRLIDTAGVRDSEDAIEQEGIQRTHRQIENAELVLELVDGSQAPDQQPRVPLPASGKRLLVLNKSDLGEAPQWKVESAVRLSCTDGTGLDQLSASILETIGGFGDSSETGMIAINARHQACLTQAQGYLKDSRACLTSGESPEFVALELRAALDAIGQVIGKTDVEEILGEIFSSFCIGK